MIASFLGGNRNAGMGMIYSIPAYGNGEDVRSLALASYGFTLYECKRRDELRGAGHVLGFGCYPSGFSDRQDNSA